MKRVLACLAAASVLAGSMIVSAQSPETLSFEVASVRAVVGAPQANAPCAGAFDVTPGRITATTTVYRLLTLAYGMVCVAASSLDLVSGPDWVKTAPFNIQATFPPGTPVYSFQQLNSNNAPELQTMLRTLLADRFHLVAHRTSKDAPIYNVYFVKEGKVTRSADGTKSSQPDNALASPVLLRRDAAAGLVYVTAKAIPIGALLSGGQGREGRFVVDKTGMTGLYDIEPSVIDVGQLPDGISIWPQMMSYLGFKLESTHGPVDSIVIDRVERPDEN